MKFKYEADVEVIPADFHIFDAVHHLDPHYYANAPKSIIHLGYLHGLCCRRMVTAIVEKGMVTQIEMEPCDAEHKDAVDLASKLNWAELREKLPKPPPLPHFPMPLTDFVERLDGVEWWTCFRICIFDHCLFCCFGGDPFSSYHHCSVSSTAGGKL